MTGFKVYTGSAFTNITPNVSKTAGSFAQPTSLQVYTGTSWITVWNNVTFTNPPGTYNKNGTSQTGFTTVCNQTATWTYSISGDTAFLSRSPASGGSGTTASFQLTDDGGGGATSASVTNLKATVSGVIYGTWTINMSCSGGGGGGSTMTL